MRLSGHRSCRLMCTALLIGLLAATSPLRAGEGGFVATLSADQQAAAGLTGLSPEECVVLDQLLAGELASVRRGDTPELAGTFVGRRTEAERKAAGLDRLSQAQLTKLNEYAASTLAARPKPKERPRLKESDVLAAARENRIHGSVTVAYGWGRGGRDLWAQSLWLDYYDPESGLGLGIGLSNFNGDGFFGCYPDYYGYGYGYGRYFGSSPVVLETSYRAGDTRSDFSFGDGQTFRSSEGRGGGRFFNYGGRRGR